MLSWFKNQVPHPNCAGRTDVRPAREAGTDDAFHALLIDSNGSVLEEFEKRWILPTWGRDGQIDLVDQATGQIHTRTPTGIVGPVVAEQTTGYGWVHFRSSACSY